MRASTTLVEGISPLGGGGGGGEGRGGEGRGGEGRGGEGRDSHIKGWGVLVGNFPKNTLKIPESRLMDVVETAQTDADNF